jgi:hypothetical protein
MKRSNFLKGRTVMEYTKKESAFTCSRIALIAGIFFLVLAVA